MIKQRGVDIAEKRLDFLSKAFFSFLIKQNAGQVILDLGCGSGAVGIASAFLHHKSFLYDINDNFTLLKKVKRLKKDFSLKIDFNVVDLGQVDYATFPKNINIAYLGSFLHYLKYADAIKLLKILKKGMVEGAYIFVSVSGVEASLSDKYPVGVEIEKRFCLLDKIQADRFSIHKPVTLYSEQELKTLLETVGFDCVEIKKTAFGNIKAVFKK